MTDFAECISAFLDAVLERQDPGRQGLVSRLAHGAPLSPPKVRVAAKQILRNTWRHRMWTPELITAIEQEYRRRATARQMKEGA
jgi:hypothetical protein